MSSNETTTQGTEAGSLKGPAPRSTLLLLIVGILSLGLIAGLGVGVGSTAACVACHASQATAADHSLHADVACRTCHFAAQGPVVSRIDVVTRMLPSAIGGVELDGAGRSVGREVCVDCHAAILTAGTTGDRGLRIDHGACAGDLLCENCHSESVHGASTRMVRSPSMTQCVACHLDKKAPLGCSSCHDGKLPAERIANPEWDRIHGPDWERMHGTGDLRTCVSCHAIDSCRPCHSIDFPHPANFGATHGTLAKRSGTDACLTCHKRVAYCNACHGTEMPHPDGFLTQHSSIAVSVVDPDCVHCHVVDDCETCHTYHVHPGGTQPPVGRTGGG